MAIHQDHEKLTASGKLAPGSSDIMFVEILVEIMEVTSLPITQRGKLVLSVGKKQPGVLFGRERRISLCTEAEETQAVLLQCEPEGELLFELSCDLDQDLAAKIQSKSFGTTSVPIADLLKSVSKLTTLKSLEFGSGTEPITLSVAVSITPPSPAPYYALQMLDEDAYSGKEVDGARCKNGGGKCLGGGGICHGGVGKCRGAVYGASSVQSIVGNGGGRCLVGGGGGKCHGGGGKCHGAMYGASSVQSIVGNGGGRCLVGGGGGKCHGGGGGKCHGAVYGTSSVQPIVGNGGGRCLASGGGGGGKCHGGGGKCHSGGGHGI